MGELKKTDYAILAELTKDSRQSFRMLAKKIGTSVSTVIKRVHLLQQEGIIKDFTISVDHHKLGYEYHALVEIVSRQQEHRGVVDWLQNRKEVYAVYQVTGTKDVYTLIRTKDQAELRGFLDGMQRQEGVDRTETRIIFEAPYENSGCQSL